MNRFIVVHTAGRDDVFAKRFENAKKGIAGYIPVCNLLSYGLSEESIMRIESMEIAAELMGTV